MSDHFGRENHMVIGDADEYERQLGHRQPRRSIDMRRGYPEPMVTDVTAEEIESMRVMELRRNQDIGKAIDAVQSQIDMLRKFPIFGRQVE